MTITLNGRTYRLRCEDGEEQRLLALGAHLREHVDRLTREFGQVGDDRLLLMAGLLVTDELFEARDALGAGGGAKATRLTSAIASEALTEARPAPPPHAPEVAAAKPAAPTPPRPASATATPSGRPAVPASADDILQSLRAGDRKSVSS